MFHFNPHIGIDTNHSFFRTCRYFYGLCSSKIPRYFFDFTFNSYAEIQVKMHTTFNFTPHIGIQCRQTDKLRYISSLLLESMYDRRTHFISFHPHIWASFRRTHCGKVSPFNWYLRKTDGRKNYVLFHSSYCGFRHTNRQSRFPFTPTVGIQARQMDKLRYIQSLTMESK